ncbi:hypothetical protein F5B22DRAFT_610524 [Xylaria bambusicola]|uniref:uncharacterized protein n=1 Tax=Xylaria bambusicola TaxID=326684 RepID=UPI0020073E3A|nr:uncharacterized protein F5B22DRAFT_610524 [Xylaria bambusicola]KAI0514727.1 hypothetical protein F5B22DRAFT_610524 [Xylaria bambusicola]
MPFDPSETDVEEYESAYTEGLVFEVNRLLPGRSQFSIELAIQKISRDIIRETSKGVETVTIYWGRLNSTSTTTRTEYHHGWCHIVCSSWMLKRALKMRLHYEELFPGTRKRVTTGAAAEPMVCKTTTCS